MASAIATATATTDAPADTGFDVEKVRADFPVFSTDVRGKPVVFLDTGASAQKPRQVIDAITHAYQYEYANVHRGTYWLSERATTQYEAARSKVAGFLNAERDEEIIFTMGGTDAINLVANTWGKSTLVEGDEIIVSTLEHHANIVPWQMLRDEKGLVLKVAPITDEGELDLAAFEALLTPRTKLVAMAHTSNVLGTILPAEKIIALAHAAGAKVLLDGCQGVVHGPVDVRALDVDFFVFSGHKLYGPTGIGALYAKYALLEAMPPWRGGGDMIETVTFEKSTWAEPPSRFEAGTPPIVQAIGLGAAVDYVASLGTEAIAAHEADVLRYATQRLASVPGLTLYGTAVNKAGVLSFTMDCAHPHDVATILDRSGICVRVGHHCAQPLMARLGIPATVRASLGLYNTRADIDALVAALEKVREFFA